MISGMKKLSNDRREVLTHDFIPGHKYEVRVRAVGPDGVVQAMEDAPAATIVIEGKNITPGKPTNAAATGYLNSITVAWTNADDYDLSHVEVWRSAVDDRDFATKIADVTGEVYTDILGSGGLTRYYWLRSVNTSGKYSDYTESVNGTSDEVKATDIDDFTITATKMFTNTIILSGDSWSDDSPGAGSIAWNSHTVVYGGAAYTIAAGNTSDEYVYWVAGSASYSTSTTHPSLGSTGFMVSVNRSGVHELVWNSSANMVIGTAFIADLAVTNAKVQSLSASKLTAGTIDASVITVTKLNASNISTGTITAIPVQTASSGARVTLLDGCLGLEVVDDASNSVFRAYISGADVGDVVMGDETGGQYAKWDKSASSFIVRGSLNADDITAGTLTGRTVQTASSGQRIVLSQSDNTLRFHTSTVNNVLVIDDTIEGSYPGMSITDATHGGVLIIYKDATHQTKLYHRGMAITGDASPGLITLNHTGSTNFLKCYDSGANRLEIDIDGNMDTEGYVDAATGFKDNGVAGVDGTFTDDDGNTITVSGGIITDLGQDAE